MGKKCGVEALISVCDGADALGIWLSSRGL